MTLWAHLGGLVIAVLVGQLLIMRGERRHAAKLEKKRKDYAR